MGQRLEEPRDQGVQEEQGCNGWRSRGPRLHGATPRRTKGASFGTRKDQGRSRARLVAPGRILTILVVTVINNQH